MEARGYMNKTQPRKESLWKSARNGISRAEIARAQAQCFIGKWLHGIA
jgi:hypothetical protein